MAIDTQGSLPPEADVPPVNGTAATGASADAAFGQILQLVRFVEAGMQTIDRSHGLSGSQLFALWHLSAAPGLRVSDLANAMHLHHSTASNLLDKLESRGLVRRERQPADHRVVRLHLTEAGSRLVGHIPGPMQGHLRAALQALSPSMRENLVLAVSEVLDHLADASA